MVEHDSEEHATEHNGSTYGKAVTNFHDLCERISRLDGKIADALVIREGKLLAVSNGAGSTLPSGEYLSKLIR